MRRIVLRTDLLKVWSVHLLSRTQGISMLKNVIGFEAGYMVPEAANRFLH